MKMEKEMKYEAPEVEVLEVTVEAGYDLSGNDGNQTPDVPEGPF